MQTLKKFSEKREHNIVVSCEITQQCLHDCLISCRKWTSLKEIIDLFNLETTVAIKRNFSRKLLMLTKYEYIKRQRRNHNEYEYKVV